MSAVTPDLSPEGVAAQGRLPDGAGGSAASPRLRRDRFPGVGRRWPPDPVVVTRVVAGAVIAAVTAFMAANGEPGTVEVNLFRLVNELPNAARAPLTGVMALGALGSVPVLAALAALSRGLRLARDLLIAGGLAWVASKLVQIAVHQQPPDLILSKVLLRGAVKPGLAFPSSHVAVAAAMAAVAAVYLTRPQRRLAWIVVTAIAIARIYIGAHFPVDVAGGAALGWSVGYAVRLFTPRALPLADRLPAALGIAGILSPAIFMLGSGPRRDGASFAVTDRAGQRWHVAVAGPDQPDADWLYRAWRLLAFRDTEDRPVLTPEHRVERTAYYSLRAAAAEGAAPGPVYTGRLDDLHAWVARPWVDGRSLAEHFGELDEQSLVGAWDQLAKLHAAGLSHGSITPDHVIISSEGRVRLVRLVGIGSGALPASPAQRSRDVAELALVLATNAGVEATVAAAVTRLGPGPLGQAVASLQPLAISNAARATALAHPGLLDRLRLAAAEATAMPAPAPIRPARVAFRNLAPIVILGLAVYVLLPQAARAGSTITALGHANPAWIGVVAGATVCTYLASAAAWIAAAPVPLALGRTFVVQFAAASANRVIPAGLGGMATNINYVQRAGATRAQALTATALISGAGFVVHSAGLAGATILGAGGAGWRIPTADLGDHWPVLLAVTLSLVAAGVWTWVARAARFRRRVRPIAHDIATTARRMLANPTRTGLLLLASSGVTASYAAAFVASAHAYGSSAPLAKLVVVYLGAAAVAAVAPTPGGLGALDAALVAGLGAAGTPPGGAVAAVLTYRTVTYWLPVIPGLIAQRALRRRLLL